MSSMCAAPVRHGVVMPVTTTTTTTTGMMHATTHARVAVRHGAVATRSPMPSMGDLEFDLLFEDEDEDEEDYHGAEDDEGCAMTLCGKKMDVESMLIRNLRALCAPRGEEATAALEALREATRGISHGDSRAFKDDSRAEHVRKSGLEKLESALQEKYPMMFAHVQRSKTSCAARGAESLRKLTHHYLWLPPSARAPAVSLSENLSAMHGGRYRSMDERVIIEPNLRSHFVVGRATEAYKRFVEEVPECFVGSHAQLGEIVSFMCAQMTASFRDVGLDIPPWRQPAALTSKWACQSLSSATSSPSNSPVTPFSFNKNSFVDAFMAKAAP